MGSCLYNNLMKYTFAMALLVALVDGKKLTQKAAVHAKGDEFYTPFEKGMLGAKEYKRVIPARFQGDGDDIYMRSMIENYALEKKLGGDDDATKDTPTGKFFLDETGAKAAASEVLGTHKGLSGDKLKSYLGTYWAKAWGHFDVNQSGKIEVEKAPSLMRFLASDQAMSLQ